MSKQYTHLTLAERDTITTMLAEKESLRKIAQALGRNASSISRELQRNASGEYRLYLSHRADMRAVHRRKLASSRPRLKNARVRSYVSAKLREGWSPEQIAGRIGLDHPGLAISHEAIYQYIYHPHTPARQEFIRCLRRRHRRRTVRSPGRREHKTKIPNRVPIDCRPAAAAHRRQFGHWEGDSLVSRKSRLLCLTRLPHKTAQATVQAISARLGVFPDRFRRSLTLDNGTENASHEKITSNIGLRCYFSHPYASWERGTCENTNALIRWYLPKGTDFSTISMEQIAHIESLLNNRPRKCLGFRTPIEVATPYVALRD